MQRRKIRHRSTIVSIKLWGAKMTTVRLKYLHSFIDRFGHVRYYFRYRGNRWPLPAPHEEGFATAYDALLTQIKANPIAIKNNVAFMRGSLGWVIERFLVSPAYETRAEATKRNYRRVIDTLKQRYGTGLIKDLQPRHVKKIRNEIREAFTASAADIAISILSTLWDFADEQLSLDLPGADPTFGIKRVHVGHREHEPWPQDLIARFMADASPRLGFAVRLAFGTGLRRSDLVKLRWQDLRGDHFHVCQQKTGEPVLVGVTAELLAELETMPRAADTIIVGDLGKSITAASLSRMVRTAQECGAMRLRRRAGPNAKSWCGLVTRLRRWPRTTRSEPTVKPRCGPP